ncbi:MAG: EamA family transporter [Flavipsychrobacter sp.]|jgi:drug/metabolite transporter (DMT)-like permease|nr:EamA family transporter [Flavipsychrobacter sp.]
MKKALLQIHLAVLLWGFTGVLGRAIDLSAPVLVWYRMLLTAVFMFTILKYRGQWLSIGRRDIKPMAAVGCLMALHWVAFYGSIKFSNASIALVCLSTASIFTSMLDPFVNKGKHDIYELLLGLLALAGVFLIYHTYRFEQSYVLGIIFGVIAAILSSVFTVINKRIANRYPARTIVFYEMTTGLALLTLLMPLQLFYVPGTVVLPSAMDWVWLVVLSLCCTVWAQSLALNALKHISSFTATLSVNLEPVYGIVLAFIFFKENKELHGGFYAGMALICLSVVLQTIRILRPKASPGYIKEKAGID